MSNLQKLLVGQVFYGKLHDGKTDYYGRITKVLNNIFHYEYTFAHRYPHSPTPDLHCLDTVDCDLFNKNIILVDKMPSYIGKEFNWETGFYE